jgi:hypothetical protein
MSRHREAVTPLEIRVGEVVNEPTAGTVRTEGRMAQTVRLKERLDVTAVEVHSVSNDNQRFFIRARMGKMQAGTPVYLGVEGRWWWGGLGTTLVDSEGVFEVDRAAATSIALACSVPLHERSPLDTGLRCTWRFPERVMPGLPAMVTLHIANEGPTALLLWYCPYWLELEATRDGSPVPIDARIYSGPSAIARLAPGARVDLDTDLRDVMSLDEPGRYALTATFRGNVERDDPRSRDAYRTGGTWDVRWSESGALLVGT